MMSKNPPLPLRYLYPCRDLPKQVTLGTRHYKDTTELPIPAATTNSMERERETRFSRIPHNTVLPRLPFCQQLHAKNAQVWLLCSGVMEYCVVWRYVVVVWLVGGLVGEVGGVDESSWLRGLEGGGDYTNGSSKLVGSLPPASLIFPICTICNSLSVMNLR